MTEEHSGPTWDVVHAAIDLPYVIVPLPTPGMKPTDTPLEYVSVRSCSTPKPINMENRGPDETFMPDVVDDAIDPDKAYETP